MLVKQRKHFRHARSYNGDGIFSDITSAISRAVTSKAAKAVGEKALEGVTKGIQQGAEYGTRELTKKAVDSLTSPKAGAKTKAKPVSSKDNIDARTRQLLDSLKSGSGIKTIY